MIYYDVLSLGKMRRRWFSKFYARFLLWNEFFKGKIIFSYMYKEYMWYISYIYLVLDVYACLTYFHIWNPYFLICMYYIIYIYICMHVLYMCVYTYVVCVVYMSCIYVIYDDINVFPLKLWVLISKLYIYMYIYTFYKLMFWIYYF